jgi:hypothetical protein
MPSLRIPEPESLSGLKKRAGEFLRYVADHRDNPLTTIWGDYSRFDVYGLALLELGDSDAEAHRLLSETLDMIDRNFSEERADPGDRPSRGPEHASLA